MGPIQEPTRAEPEELRGPPVGSTAPGPASGSLQHGVVTALIASSPPGGVEDGHTERSRRPPNDGGEKKAGFGAAGGTPWMQGAPCAPKTEQPRKRDVEAPRDRPDTTGGPQHRDTGDTGWPPKKGGGPGQAAGFMRRNEPIFPGRKGSGGGSRGWPRSRDAEQKSQKPPGREENRKNGARPHFRGHQRAKGAAPSRPAPSPKCRDAGTGAGGTPAADPAKPRGVLGEGRKTEPRNGPKIRAGRRVKRLRPRSCCQKGPYSPDPAARPEGKRLKSRRGPKGIKKIFKKISFGISYRGQFFLFHGRVGGGGYTR